MWRLKLTTTCHCVLKKKKKTSIIKIIRGKSNSFFKKLKKNTSKKNY